MYCHQHKLPGQTSVKLREELLRMEGEAVSIGACTDGSGRGRGRGKLREEVVVGEGGHSGHGQGESRQQKSV